MQADQDKKELEKEWEEEREDWVRIARYGLSRAYGDDEPDYSDVPLIKANPAYKPDQANSESDEQHISSTDNTE